MAGPDPDPVGPNNANPEEPEKWVGWPGDNVFRIIVPEMKVGSIIGRKGEFVKSICDHTRARVRVLHPPPNTTDRVVLISGKEEPDAPLSPAMNATIRLFKRVTGLGEGDDNSSAAEAAAFCSFKLLVASNQAINLIGKQGSTIKSIQEISGAVVRILLEGELPSYAASDERIVEIQGEAFKVLKGLEAVLGHLRKFLHHHGVIAVFEKTHNETISQDQVISADHSLSLKRETYIDHEAELEPRLSHSSLSFYGTDSVLGGLHSSEVNRSAGPIITQITQTMQLHLSYAEDIIGIAGRNIAYIRRTSGAALSIQESHVRADEITVEIKGTASEVQTAQQLIQESLNNCRTTRTSSIYGKGELGLSSTYSPLSDSTYHSSSHSSLRRGNYSSSGLRSYRF